MLDINLNKLLGQLMRNEGYYDAPSAQDGPNRPQRNRNPGDLKGAGWQGQSGTDGGFCIFREVAVYDILDPVLTAEMLTLNVLPSDYWGYRALRLDITNHAAEWPDQDLLNFVAGETTDGKTWPGYAPASDSNDSFGYALSLAKAIGCETETKFCDL